MATVVELAYDEVVARTDEAMLFSVDGEDIWIPKSCIEDERLEDEWETNAYGDDAAEGHGTLHVAIWFAEREGLV
jgi:hypothetical protein